MEYYIIKPATYKDGVVLSGVPDVSDNEKLPNAYKYDKGIPLLKNYPSRDIAIMVYDTDELYEDREELYDFLPNMDNTLVANIKVKEILEELGVENIEFLPITIWDREKKPIEADYYIINPVGSVEIIDMEKSKYRMGALIKDQIKRIKNLVINRNAVTEKDKLFRATTKLDQIFINEEIRQAFIKAGIKGYWLSRPNGWDGLGIGDHDMEY